ncbi:MAG: PilZ domain-containing protein [Myxococcales bacterium]|nr:PilZ domain-containing protein [Myxococcales bacterium]MDH5306478.1 PilZ domain-containing protein [Myxococcales bacterium]MDH5566919.1 PilZ domain-containing protein [Myxococcales bacterium]
MPESAHEDRRSEARKKKNLFCQLECCGRFYPAVILDISPSGLFVRTTATAPPGTRVEVTLRLAGGHTWTLPAEVARDPQSNPALDPIPARGLGLRITDPPDGFAAFVADL